MVIIPANNSYGPCTAGDLEVDSLLQFGVLSLGFPPSVRNDSAVREDKPLALHEGDYRHGPQSWV